MTVHDALLPQTSRPAPPADLDALLSRARELAGRSLGELAARQHQRVPADLRGDKGWIGKLIEVTLGARAGSKPHPDFEHLGVELKTLPIGRQGRPRQSTFVCAVPTDALTGLTWDNSHVRRKLQQVLWVPIQADPNLPLSVRRVGMPSLWSCDDPRDGPRLQADWDDLMGEIRLGYIDSLTAHRGVCLQVRPKVTKETRRATVVGEDGWSVMSMARGFYLRASFTRELIARHYAG